MDSEKHLIIEPRFTCNISVVGHFVVVVVVVVVVIVVVVVVVSWWGCRSKVRCESGPQ